MNWSDTINVERALDNVQHDIFGDWYRDPWSWPELEWVVEHRPEIVAARLNARGAKQVMPLSVPKEQFGIRPAVVLDPIDRLAVQSLTDTILPDIFADAHPWVFGWRPRRKNPTAGKYADSAREWTRYRTFLRTCASEYQYAVRTDVANFFPTIDVHLLLGKVRSRSRQLAAIARLEDFLHGVTAQPEASGLPQRCLSSSSLANIYLTDTDAMLPVQPYLDEVGEGPAAARWMDDYWLFTASESLARDLQVQLTEALAADGLSLNSGKTELLVGDDIDASIDTFSHSAGEPRPLSGRTMLPKVQVQALVEEILEDPSSASRTNISFTARLVADLAMKREGAQLIVAAPRMPHGADHIARMSRRLKLWDGPFLEFLSSYVVSDWPRFEWSLTQYITGIPMTKAAGKKKAVRLLTNALVEEASSSTDLGLQTAVLSRLAVWDPESALQLASSLLSRTESPLLYRAAGLFMLSSGSTPKEVTRVLSTHEENFVTLLMLQATGWKAVPVVRDFSGRRT